MSWVCPVCSGALVGAATLQCGNGHAFDIAKEGYVNFLVGQKPKYFGDAPEMLAARRRFLDAEFYEPLRKLIGKIVGEGRHDVVMEVGCGEGHYIGGIFEQFNGSKFLGTDIAKEGVRMAAKRYPNVAFAVADTNKFLPVADASVDVLLNIFAPRNSAEFARVLSEQGRLVVVIPTSKHLVQLRQMGSLLAVQADKREMVVKVLGERFDFVSAETLSVPMQLNGDEVLDLVTMTPNGWFMSGEYKEQWLGVGEVNVTAEFEVLIFVHKR